MSAFFKDIYREIKNTMGRFISLIIITSLGAMSVAGIQASSIDMRDIADKIYREHNLYDIQVKSTTGFTDEDIAELKKNENISDVMPSYITDVFTYISNSALAIRVYSLPEKTNTLDIIDGRLPEKADECVLEQRFINDGRFKIGDTITFTLDKKEDYSDKLKIDTFTIVGIVASPLYISGHERGNTTLGDGSLAYYAFFHPDVFKYEVYTDLYITLKESQKIYNLGDKYDNAAEEWKEEIKKSGNTRVQLKKEEFAENQRDIDDGLIEYNDGLEELKSKIEEGKTKLSDARKKLEDSIDELEKGQIELDGRIAGLKSEIDKKAEDFNVSKAELDEQLSQLDAWQNKIDESKFLLKTNRSKLKKIAPQGVSPELDVQYAMLAESEKQIDAEQNKFDDAKALLTEPMESAAVGEQQIEDAYVKLEGERINAQKSIDDGWVEYNKGLTEYNDGVKKLDEEEADAAKKLDNAKAELEDAQKKLDKAPEPEWFYFTRSDGIAFDSYYQDTLRLQKIGYVFPMVFLLVAVMVSLTSMSRMVEEHRMQIGIYKALGYSPIFVMVKYLIYAFSASFLGGTFGILGGSYIFPRVISDAYNHLYDMPPVATPIPLAISVIAMTTAVASVFLVTLFTCINSMHGEPANLMRPKAPPAGKRVLIERISFIWNLLNFSGKVTARNIFRYKKRFIMTLAGVAGCSALLLTAFGLRDSIGGVSKLQYETIIKYDARTYLKEIKAEKDYNELTEILPASHLFIHERSVDAKTSEGGFSAFIIVPEFPEKFNDYFNIHNPVKRDKQIFLEGDDIFISDKLARVMGISEGDTFEIADNDGKVHNVRADAIVENYVLHYIYMTPAAFEKIFGVEPYLNSVLAKDKNSKQLAEKLFQNNNVRAVSLTESMLKNLNRSTDALGIVTIVLIILACALAFVVLFNLTNINISERIRELATIKVLGFQNIQLAMYIYRENAIVTLIGILIGLFAGVLLHGFVIGSVEVDLLKFPHIIYFKSYIYSVILSVVFAVFVNLVMNFKLAKISMVESLKSVE